MTKDDFAKAIAARAGVTKAAAIAMLDAARDISLEAVKAGDEVALKGWMTISAKQMPERPGRNPKTGELVTITARKRLRVKFHGSYKV